MDCPNCYTKGLSSRLMRCPRCDWLLVGEAPSGSSAAFPTPPLSNPWAESAGPELPTLPAGPSTQNQLSQLWRLDRQEAYHPGVPEQPGMEQSVPLQGDQRTLLVALGLSALMPVVVLFIVSRVFWSFPDVVRSSFALLGWIALIVWLLAAIVLTLSIRRAMLVLIDAIEGVGVQSVDRVSSYAPKRSGGKGASVVFERHGTLIALARQAPPRIGERYRVVYSPRTRLLLTLEPLDQPAPAAPAAAGSPRPLR